MWGKLIDGKLEIVPKNMQIGNTTICNPSDDTLRELGYKPVVETPKPEYIIGITYTLSYSETATQIVYIWNRTDDLPLAKQLKLSELQSIRDSKKSDDITTSKGTFKVRQEDREMINGKVARMSDTDTAYWILADDSIAQLTKADLIEVQTALVNRTEALFYAYAQLKARVENATTIEEVVAVTWEN